MSWRPRHYAALAALVAAGAAALWLAPGREKADTAFVGQYGYAFRLSPATTRSHKVTATFRDEKRTSEVVFVHPRSMEARDVFAVPESRYAQEKIVRLEINPNSLYPADAQDRLVEAFRFAARKTLEDKGEKYRFSELEGAPLPGFALEIDRPDGPVTQVFMKGEEVHYLLTGHGGERALHEVLSSLVDTSVVRKLAGEGAP